MPAARTLLIATPSCDVYGSDLQMLETVAAMRALDWRVVVTAPATGPLVARLHELGAEFELLDVPVLRRSAMSPTGVVGLAVASLRALPRMLGILRRTRPDVLLVNTITLPLWPVVGRLGRRTTVCHVHEAEDKDRRIVRRVMALPLQLAQRLIMNSRTTRESLCGVAPALRKRSVVITNGVTPPPDQPAVVAERHDPPRVVVVGRLSARKAPDVALDAIGRLRRNGHQIDIELVGTPAEGAEAFRDELVRRSEEDDLAGAVTFAGYVSPTWPALARADIAVAPSLGESFGNAVVEAQLALRPVVATAVQGHLETVTHEETGLLVPPNDAVAIAEAIARLLDEPALAERLATKARTVALERFTSARYRADVQELMTGLAEA